MKQKHKKYTEIHVNTNKSIYAHCEMGPFIVTKPNPENCKNCSSKRACTASLHNTTQNSSDNLPSYLQTNIIAQMLSVGLGGEGLAGGLSKAVLFSFYIFS